MIFLVSPSLGFIEVLGIISPSSPWIGVLWKPFRLHLLTSPRWKALWHQFLPWIFLRERFLTMPIAHQFLGFRKCEWSCSLRILHIVTTSCAFSTLLLSSFMVSPFSNPLISIAWYWLAKSGPSPTYSSLPCWAVYHLCLCLLCFLFSFGWKCRCYFISEQVNCRSNEYCQWYDFRWQKEFLALWWLRPQSHFTAGIFFISPKIRSPWQN